MILLIIVKKIKMVKMVNTLTSLLCKSAINPSWTHIQGSRKMIVVSKADPLIFKRVSKNNRGIYECYGINKQGYQFMNEYTLHVQCKL